MYTKRIGEIYARFAKSATSYYSLIVLPLTNFALHPLTCCVIGKGIKGLVEMLPYGNALLFQFFNVYLLFLKILSGQHNVYRRLWQKLPKLTKFSQIMYFKDIKPRSFLHNTFPNLTCYNFGR